MLSVIMLSVIMLSVIMVIVAALQVVPPRPEIMVEIINPRVVL
jgi:hypothetical protein